MFAISARRNYFGRSSLVVLADQLDPVCVGLGSRQVQVGVAKVAESGKTLPVGLGEQLGLCAAEQRSPQTGLPFPKEVAVRGKVLLVGGKAALGHDVANATARLPQPVEQPGQLILGTLDQALVA